jgi:phosphatidylglycerophosphate synthase
MQVVPAVPLPLAVRVYEEGRRRLGTLTDASMKRLSLTVLKVLPNALTFSRPILGLVAVVFFMEGTLVHSFIGCVVCLIGALTDFYDGDFARKIAKEYPGLGITKFGEVWDPICDKLFVLILALANPFFLFALVPEIFSSVSSIYVRNKLKKHFIAFGSKAATAFQFIFILGVFFTFFPEWKEVNAGLITLCSIIRFFSYVQAIEKRRDELAKHAFAGTPASLAVDAA